MEDILKTGRCKLKFNIDRYNFDLTGEILKVMNNTIVFMPDEYSQVFKIPITKINDRRKIN